MGEGKTQLVVTANPEPAGQGVAVDGSNESLTGIECVCRWNRHLTLSFGEYHLEGWNLEVPNRHTGLRRRRRYTTGLRLIGFVIFMSTRKRKQRKKKKNSELLPRLLLIDGYRSHLTGVSRILPTQQHPIWFRPEDNPSLTTGWAAVLWCAKITDETAMRIVSGLCRRLVI